MNKIAYLNHFDEKVYQVDYININKPKHHPDYYELQVNDSYFLIPEYMLRMILTSLDLPENVGVSIG